VTAAGRTTRSEPVACEEYGYGLGSPTGILVLRYRAAGPLAFGGARQDFLHQFYWSPDGVLVATHGGTTRFVGRREAFWVRRAVDHEVRAADRQTVHRVCLREVPPHLTALRAGAVSLDEGAARLVTALARPDFDERAAPAARLRVLAGLGATTEEFVAHHAVGTGFAMTVARSLSHDPGDPTRLDEWAARLHISVKTLQRDFAREFGMTFTQWRTKLRLRAARALLGTEAVGAVAHRVGYASPSAFVTAFAKEYGYTPGRHAVRAGEDGLTG
jgi:AraC-like DNA-binding protein